MLCPSGFVDNVMFADNGVWRVPKRAHIVKVTHQKAARIFPS